MLVKVNFIFNMSYLLIGYYLTESNEYDILWTMPHCVLVLRLIGFGFDVADGRPSESDLSKDQKDNCIKEMPNIVQLMAYSYFPSSFIVGPQFPFNRYKHFINNEFTKYKSYMEAGIKRGSVGVLYLIIRQIGAVYLPDDYFLSSEYSNKSFITQIVQLGLWGKISLYKYISCWLLAEGSLTLLGLSHSPKNGQIGSDTKDDWTACSNVKLVLLETGTRMLHYVQSFNVNTNNWVAAYVYKRLKFLNSRTISYAGALLFLAVWHGFHSGYYMAFALEYTIITFEKQIESFYNTVIKPNKIGRVIENNLFVRGVLIAIMKFYNIVMMGWCLTPFIQLSYNKWMVIYSSSGYWGFYLLGIWTLIHLFYQFLLNPKHKNPLLKDKDQ
ncbi:LPCAT3 family protein [Megaselia abdita]